jgi:PIN domain nuclease of toxin-antitoxin system
MNFLLDTHVLLWWLDNPNLISETARLAIGDSDNRVFVSAATAWEIAIKKTLGKLDAPDDLKKVLRKCRFSLLSITVEHALAVRNLPLFHNDPFDRMLVAQTMFEGLTIVTRDSDILRYPVAHLLA